MQFFTYRPGSYFNAYWLSVALAANQRIDFSTEGPGGELCGTFVMSVQGMAGQNMGCHHLPVEASCFRLWMFD